MMFKQFIFISFLLCSSLFLQAQWTTQDLSLPRADIGAGTINGKIFFAGGSPENSVADIDMYKRRVDIYDISSDNWTTEQLSVTRQYTFAVGVGTKMYFAGYTQIQAEDQEVVEVYDTEDGSWSNMTMPGINGATSMCAAGDKVFFVHNNNVKIYNTTSESWSSATLSVNRILAYAISCNGKVLFAGGGFAAGTLYDLVDIYDTNTDTWTTTNMSEGKNSMKAACLNNKVYFVGGLIGFYDYTDVIEIYNTENDSWDTAQMTTQKSALTVAATHDNLYIGGGYDENENESSNEVEIIDGTTGIKTLSNISGARVFVSGIAEGNNVYFAGGYEEELSLRVTTVDIYSEGTSRIGNIQQSDYKVIPNPTQGEVTLIAKNGQVNKKSLSYRLYNPFGVLLFSGICHDKIDLSTLQAGFYYVVLEGSELGWQKIVKL